LILSNRQSFAKKSLGQNFLVDRNFISKIVDAVAPAPPDTVIEVGPGHGALTEPLLERCGTLVAVELDRELIPILHDRFGDIDRFELINEDVLKIDFSEVHPGHRLKLVANLPYYISTAVLLHLLPYRDRFSSLVLMFQREVVDRMTAKPGTSDRGFLTVMVETFFEVERLFDVPPSSFRPVPKVWSSVVRLRPRADVGSPAGKEAEFEKLVGIAFRQKRKTILNNLKRAANDVGLVNPVQLLSAASIDPKRRAETLAIDEWKRLFANWVPDIS